MDIQEAKKELVKILEEEKVLKELFLSKPEDAAKRARELANKCKEIIKVDKQNEKLASAWLRLARRAGMTKEEWGPIAEALLARFPDSYGVLSGVVWLKLDLTKDKIKNNEYDIAIENIKFCFDVLKKVKDPSYIANALLGIIKIFINSLGVDRLSEWESTIVYADTLLTSIEEIYEKWFYALSKNNSQPQPNEENKVRREEKVSPRLRMLFLIRKLAKFCEKWDLLVKIRELAKKEDMDNEWLAEAEIDALRKMGKIEEALNAVIEAKKKFPSEHISRMESKILMETGNEVDSIKAMFETALSSKTPWPWRDLGDMVLNTGTIPNKIKELLPDYDINEIVALFWKIGLSYHNLREPGKVWKIHFNLSKLLLSMGDEIGSAKEAVLAKEARIAGGWGVGMALERYLTEKEKWLNQHINKFSSLGEGELRKQVREEYVNLREEFFRKIAKPGKIITLRPAFGFIEVEGLKEKVFFKTKTIKLKDLKVGDKIWVIPVKSFDPKKKKESLKAVWISRKGV